MKKFSKILVSLVVTMMMLTGLVANAENYDGYRPIQGDTTSFKKYLVMNPGTKVPNATFTFTIEAGQAEAGTATTVKQLAGLNPELVSASGTDVTDGETAVGTKTFYVGFNSGDLATDAYGAEALGDAHGSEVAAKKDITLSFANITFTEPGVYRYIITETATSNADVTMDTKTKRTLDVYVVDNNGALEVASYVMYEGDLGKTAGKVSANAGDISDWLAENPAPVAPTVADPTNPTPEEAEALDEYERAKAAWEANKAAAQAAADAAALAANPNGAEAGLPKSDKYVNKYLTYDLVVKKEVTGNQGSKDQYFKFTVTFSDGRPNAIIDLKMPENLPTDWENSTVTPNAATTYTKGVIYTANSRDDDATLTGQQIKLNANGGAEVVLYLQHGEQAKFLNIPEGTTDPETGDVTFTKYKVEEAESGQDGYTTTGEVTTAKEVGTVEMRFDEVQEDSNLDEQKYTFVHIDGGITYTYKYDATNSKWVQYGSDGTKSDVTLPYNASTTNVYLTTEKVVNHRNGVLPTGVAAAASTGLIILGIGAAGMFVFGRKKDDDED